MPSLSPCSRREFVRKLSKLGYQGPFAGGKHAYMVKRGAAKVRFRVRIKAISVSNCSGGS
jgi:hypothetical protein